MKAERELKIEWKVVENPSRQVEPLLANGGFSITSEGLTLCSPADAIVLPFIGSPALLEAIRQLSEEDITVWYFQPYERFSFSLAKDTVGTLTIKRFYKEKTFAEEVFIREAYQAHRRLTQEHYAEVFSVRPKSMDISRFVKEAELSERRFIERFEGLLD